MKGGGREGEVRVVGSLQAEWREREKITFNFSRSFHGRHHRHTGGRGRGGCTLQQKQARTVCAWVPLRARHSKNPKPVLFFFGFSNAGKQGPGNRQRRRTRALPNFHFYFLGTKSEKLNKV